MNLINGLMSELFVHFLTGIPLSSDNQFPQTSYNYLYLIVIKKFTHAVTSLICL